MLKTQQGQCAFGVPPPPRTEEGRLCRQYRLFHDLPDSLRLKVMKYVRQRETVLLGQANIQSVIGSPKLVTQS